MKLYYSNTSPYSRKARMVLRIKNLEANIDERLVLPTEDPVELHAANPLGKIPTLVLDNGDALFDSPLVCRYLNSLSDTTELFPEDKRKWTVLRGQALADGMTDAAFNLAAENRRPANEQSILWKSRWEGAIKRALNEIENRIEELDSELNIAPIATAAALTYLELRLPGLFAEHEYVNTRAWLDTFKQHRFVIETKFVTTQRN